MTGTKKTLKKLQLLEKCVYEIVEVGSILSVSEVRILSVKQSWGIIIGLN